MVESFIGNR